MKLPLSLAPAEAKPIDVIALGENSVDLMAMVDQYPTPGSKVPVRSFQAQSGGQAASAIIGCARQGWRTRYLGVCGDDAHGAMVKAALLREGVDLAVAERPGVASRIAIILVSRDSGERTVLEHRNGRLAMSTHDVAAAAVGDCRVLLVDGTDPQAACEAARIARGSAVPVVLDLDAIGERSAALLSLVDVAVVPEAFSRRYTGQPNPVDGARAIHENSGAALVVVTLGDNGSVAWCGGKAIRTSPFSVEAVDTTGAGDAFRAGLISGWLRFGNEASVESVLAYANALAACSCLAIGAQDGLVDREALDRFVTAAGRPWSN
jgi:sugar/nucleoside kinase (ribokinase family)